MLKKSHNDPPASHGGIHKTLERVRRLYYWPKLINDVKAYILSCEICKTTKHPSWTQWPPIGVAPESQRFFQISLGQCENFHCFGPLLQVCILEGGQEAYSRCGDKICSNSCSTRSDSRRQKHLTMVPKFKRKHFKSFFGNIKCLTPLQRLTLLRRMHPKG